MKKLTFLIISEYHYAAAYPIILIAHINTVNNIDSMVIIVLWAYFIERPSIPINSNTYIIASG